MHSITLLDEIRPHWVERVSHRLARGEDVRALFRKQLNEFMGFLRQAILTGDPAWMNSVIDQWIQSRTQSEIQRQDATLSPLLNHMLLATMELAREKLSGDDGLTLMSTLLPIYTHMINYTNQKESERHIEYISRELNRVRETLERLDRSKSDFIAVAAHELKTPLTLIEGYASMVREQLPPQLCDSHTMISLKGMDNGIRRLQEIINDMIDVSLIDNDMLQLNFQPVWLGQLLTMVGNELQTVVEERNLNLVVKEFKGSDEMTFADPERLYQVFRNLLTNAIKYTPDGGRITVDGRELPGFIEVTIADTGIGVDEADHDLIFEKFGRLGEVSLHSSGKTKFKGGGPGLGLPIAKGLVEAHGGTIWVESEGYDEQRCPGSTFHVLIPVLKETPDKKVSRLFSSLVTRDASTARASTPGS